MKRVIVLAALALPWLGLPAAADAIHVVSGVYPRAQAAQAPQSDLGGGFLQLLLTGSTRTSEGFATPRPAVKYAGLYSTPGADFAPDARPMAEPPPQFRRQEIEFETAEPPGTVIIDTQAKYLYLIEPGGRAMRYGVGVGRPGFEWAGVKHISRKAEWPDWTPPPEMLLRRPELPRHMDGGPGNPLGARALYLGSSMYRIHGTNEPWTIGQNVSSGCIRMMNGDVTDLYERVKIGTKVTVM